MPGFDLTLYTFDGGEVKYSAPNQVLAGGLDLWNDSVFYGLEINGNPVGAVKQFLFKGLISATSLTTLSSGDTMGSHPGWHEVADYYSWTYADSAGSGWLLKQQRQEFGYNASGLDSIRAGYHNDGEYTYWTQREYFAVPFATKVGGLFLSTVHTIGSTAGTLFSTARIFGNQTINFNVGDVLEVRYAFSVVPG